MMIMDLLKCFVGPELYKRYRIAPDGTPLTYNANFLETYSGTVITVLRGCYHVGIYLSPFILTSLYNRGLHSSSELVMKVGVWVALIYGGAIFFRGCGRMANRDYLEFVSVLNLSQSAPNNEGYKRMLRQYDFDFQQWPVDYFWQTELNNETVKPRRFLPVGHYQRPNGIIRRTLQDALCYFAIHTFGRRLMYPGSLWILQAGVSTALLDGRSKLVEEKKGKRYKLKSETNNSVDCMFMDRRNDPRYPNGNVLVISCEGNAGFYEIGSTITPMDAGYSVLGWNHPGFGGSTGVPLPEHECAAVDVVTQFAIHRLGFAEENIAVFAWSIGGYSATWLGMNYHNLKALVLDATFDDVLPLASRVLPSSWSPLVEQTVRVYANLHVSEQLKDYHGPVLFYRRTRDEVLSTDDSNPAAQKRSNRANDLLKQFLNYRFPKIINEENYHVVDVWLEQTPEERLRENKFNEEVCSESLRKYFTQGVAFPSNFGDDLDQNTKNSFALFLTSRYMIDFESTHCVPLPSDVFKVPLHPWDLLID